MFKNIARNKATFAVVLVIILALSYIAMFGIQFSEDSRLRGASDMRTGIDIRGGVDAKFVPKDLDHKATAEELESARNIIEARLDEKNILDRDVMVDNDAGNVMVRFPWKSGDEEHNAEKTIEELGSMAHLTFKDPDGNVVLEGKDLGGRATAQRDQGSYTGSYEVTLILSEEGRQKFKEATGRLVGQQISIYMDETMISNPKVNEAIDSTTCRISPIESSVEAKKLAEQINGGQLPFSLITQDFTTISPLLGSNALNTMVYAGLLAFILICIALILYYRSSGVIACIALLLQVVGQLLLLSWTQITVTLPGIAGIILSIGMGVDANIIISERIREELRSGKNIASAVATGFKRAFSSVFDGNITVLIVAVIMMIYGSGAMLSFAYTLIFGILMNFVAGVFATRLMTMSIIQFKFMQKTRMFLSDRSLAKNTVKVYPFYSKRKVYFAISGVIAAVGLVVLIANGGVHLDIQFTGGSVLKYEMSETVALSTDKNSTTDNTDEAAGFAEAALGGNRQVSAQITTDIATNTKRLVLNMASTEGLSNEDVQKVSTALQEKYPEQGISLAETNNVTPFFGERFLRNGIIALLLSVLLIICYVWFSFRKIHGLSAGTMAIISLLHDVMVVFFAFVIFGIPIGDSFIAVALTILGYSINDTIVIYDRIRENTLMKKSMPVEELVDKSISQSFTRSLNTNVAVFASVFIVFVFAAVSGLESVRTFALPMAIGTISGCYSTVCIAGPLWTMWQKRQERKVAERKAK